MAQGCDGLVAMVGADSAVGRCLMARLVFNCDGPGNAAQLLWEDVDALGGDGAVAMVQEACLLLGGTDQAVAAGQVVCDEGDWAPVGLCVRRGIGCNCSALVLCQQRGLNNPICWQGSTGDLGCLQRYIFIYGVQTSRLAHAYVCFACIMLVMQQHYKVLES